MKSINKFLQEARQPFIIYQDMDGCLTDFSKAVEKLGHGTLDYINSHGGDSVLWPLIAKAGETFWSEMEWMPDGKKLWEFVKKHNVKILTSPTTAKSSVTGKKKWVRKNLGSNIEVLIVKRKEKQEYAKPNSILIDDMIKTIKEWKEKGGIAIHHKNTNDTIKKLKEIIDEF